MAKLQPITLDDGFFTGTDQDIVCHIKDITETTSVDITGWSLSWKLSRRVSTTTLLTKTTVLGTIVIAGVYNATPSSNTQRATISVDDTDTDAFANGVYYHELKRLDNGVETVLLFGPCVIRKAAHTS